MSRRRGEFEHRTTIFEGAFRAWSHLGGLDPEDLETKTSAELDPLSNPIINDNRLTGKNLQKDADGSTRREYPYEPLPRAGLAHPFVQAILSPWLGPDADNEAIQLGLTTLRTWWQHRRKGESGSAIAALGTEKMKGVVEGYTRHFFTLAHCIVVNDRVQPPRGLLSRMKDLEKKRAKDNKFVKSVGDVYDSMVAVDAIRADLTDPNLTPLEKLHVAQRRQLETSNSGLTVSSSMNGIPTGSGYDNGNMGPVPGLQNLQGKCIPGKLNLNGIVDAVTLRATQLAHGGGGSGSGYTPQEVLSGVIPDGLDGQQPSYGDPNTTPVVFVSSTGDIQIAMKVDGITCAHCVKIVETVLRGCNGNKSPIAGLLDAAADERLGRVLLKIDEASSAKRIAYEASRNLSMVGYSTEPLTMSIVGSGSDPVSHADLGALATAFEVVATTDPNDIFDWSIPCTCPDNGILRGDCARHSQMNTRIFDAFTAREQQVMEYTAGCGMKYGMDCTCGPDCRCKTCPLHGQEQQQLDSGIAPFLSSIGLTSTTEYSNALQGKGYGESNNQQRLSANPSYNSFDAGAPPPTSQYHNTTSNMYPVRHADTNPVQQHAAPNLSHDITPSLQHDSQNQQQVSYQQPHRYSTSRNTRNPSILSYGNRGSTTNGHRGSIRGMSITSETTFGRAMSGLSALSIDWENLDDFDLDVDHSAHINQSGGGTGHNSPSQLGNIGGGTRRSSATRRSIMSTGSQDGGAQVTFKVQ